MLFRTRTGLILRAVGDNHGSAHALGYSVVKVRFLAVLFGGGCAGLAGAYMSLAYTPQWVENMTAGRGWIALALVVFSSWLPVRVIAGAYLFGAVTVLTFHAQALGAGIPSQFLSSLPYLATIGAGADFGEPQADAREYPGLPRQAVRSGQVKPHRLSDCRHPMRSGCGIS
jgi:ABC-type uncharacterized transport system permease subunit